MASEVLDPAARAREKAASREEDARALASGEKSRKQLQAENACFAFPRDRIRIDFSQVKSKR
ncbi:MAG TPA: hypothetical protein VM513_05830 [Kofleriaceae bacterium]|nr:hypothetical protein [Kofleriaceae bacterium]